MLKSLQETFEQLQLFANGIKPFAEDEVTAQILSRHLLKGLGTEAVDFLLLYQEACPLTPLSSLQARPHMKHHNVINMCTRPTSPRWLPTGL